MGSKKEMEKQLIGRVGKARILNGGYDATRRGEGGWGKQGKRKSRRSRNHVTKGPGLVGSIDTENKWIQVPGAT